MPDVRFTKDGSKYGIVLSYTLEEIQELGDKGFFLEAFGRLDKMIDQACYGLLHKYFRREDQLVSALTDDQLSGFEAARILYKTRVLDQALFQKIKAFKEARNVIAHDIYGHYAFAIRQADAVKDEEDLNKKAQTKTLSALEGGQHAFSRLMELLKKPLPRETL